MSLHGQLDISLENGDLETIKHISTMMLLPQHAVYVSAMKGYLHILIWLYETGKWVDTYKTMDYAAGSGRIEIVKWLYNKGLINYTRKAICVPCHLGHFEVVKFLVTNLHFENDDITTAIMLAIERGHINIVEYLYEHKQNILSVCYLRAMERAVRSGQFDIVKFLYDKSPHNYDNYDYLYDAVWGGEIEIIEFFYLVAKTIINANVMNLLCCSKVNLHIIKFVDKHRTGPWPISALEHAIQSNKLDYIRFLHNKPEFHNYRNLEIMEELFVCRKFSTIDYICDRIFGEITEEECNKLSPGLVEYLRNGNRN